ncbi:hypothetical protein N7457_009162 [Penicillium paradoxum]|uniref:uncharacterized protein n=1 Tax=Penicillium paradoxum TaxID=176176 RepID=UPI0025476E08|nr:uncharacterized protein N7457_009162 [Penicillium paradoxum]KAJ5774266.1 hypothetical protein N7457_009162 [Penicillium paradoxum]
MPPITNKEARMACSPSGEDVFIRQLQGLKADCSEALAHHLQVNPDVAWNPEDGSGHLPHSKREKARLRLALDLEFCEETGKPLFPPANTRLSDELVYLATKFEAGPTRAIRWPYDFDKSGDIDPNRVPSGPPPIVWAHGMPFFPVYKGYYILCGREHAECIGWLLHEKTRTIMLANPIWSVGAVIAPGSAVKLPHAIDRQMVCHRPPGGEKEVMYKGKAWTRDVVAAEHHHCAVLPSLDDEDITVCPLWKARGYNVHCGPSQRDVRPTTIPKDFFVRQGIAIDYPTLAKPYINLSFDDDEDPDEEMASNSDDNIEKTTEPSGKVAGKTDAPVETQPAAKMGTDSAVEVVPEQKKMQAQTQALERALEEIIRGPHIGHSNLENTPPVDSHCPVNTKLDTSMAVDASAEKVTEKTTLEQPSTEKGSTPSTEDVIESTAIRTTEVQLTTNQPENHPTDPDASPAQVPTIEPTTQQIAQEQTGSEESYSTAVSHLSQRSDATGTACSQIDGVNIDESQVPEQVVREET